MYPALKPESLQQRLFLLLCRGCRLALPLSAVERVIPLLEMQRVPQAPDYLVGLINLRGEAVPVVDLGLRLGLGGLEAYGLEIPLLLLSDGQRRLALVIDEVLGVRAVEQGDVRGGELFRDGAPPVLGAVAQPEGMALLLDARRLLALDLSGLEQPLALGDELRSLCGAMA